VPPVIEERAQRAMSGWSKPTIAWAGSRPCGKEVARGKKGAGLA